MNHNFQQTRMLSLDIFRGVAILGVVVVHLVIIGIFFAVDNGLNVLPTYVLAIFAPLILFAPMAGLFVFISATANGMTVQKRLLNKKSLSNTLQPLLVTGIILLVIHFIYIAFFKEHMSTIFDTNFAPAGVLISYLVHRKWDGFTLDHFLMIDAFAMVMEAVFFVLILCFFLFHPKNKKSVQWKMNFLVVFGVFWTILSPFLWGISLEAMEFFYYQEHLLFRLPAIFLSFFAGKMHPITTIAPFAIFGLWLSLLLFQSPSYETLRQKTYHMSLLMGGMAILSIGFKAFLCFAKENFVYKLLENWGVIHIIGLNTPSKLPHIDPTPSIEAGDLMNSILNFIVVPAEWVFITLFLCFLIYPLIIRFFDYQSVERKQILAERFRPIRRFGTLSLTVFFFECLVQTLFSQFFRSLLIPKLAQINLFSFLFEAPFYIAPKERILLFDDFMVMWPFWIIYLTLAIGGWFFVLWIWEKVGYKGSLEWFVAKISNLFRKIKTERMEAATSSNLYGEGEK